MINKTVTYNSLTHKIVPIEPTDEMALAAIKVTLPTVNGVSQWAAMIGAAPEYQAIEQIPVAIIGNDFKLLYTEIGSISEIVKRHELKVGTLLYALPPSPEGDKQ